jgi:PhnB protein
MTLTISLMLAVEDAPLATTWYKTALGASELWNLGSVVGLEIDGAAFMLHESTDGFTSPSAIGQTTVRAEVFLDEPDAFFERAIAAGAIPSDSGLKDHEAPWGVHRQGAFTDPFGHVWHVGDRSPLSRHPKDDEDQK